jgi:hypothetical protein
MFTSLEHSQEAHPVYQPELQMVAEERVSSPDNSTSARPIVVHGNRLGVGSEHAQVVQYVTVIVRPVYEKQSDWIFPLLHR